jgi:hypothetical protein
MCRRGHILAVLPAAPLAAIVVAAFAAPADAAVTETGGYPYPGVYVGERVYDDVPARVHVVEIDLSSAEIRLRATGEAERGQTTSAWAQQSGAVVAVNGDLFAPIGYVPDGLARGGAGGGQTWTIGGDTAEQGFLSFDRGGNVNHARISPPEDVVAPGDLPPEIEGVVSGRPMLVRAGVAAATFDCDDAVTIACERAPRAAVGVSQDGRTLFIVVVDGWQASSLGWTLAELAQFMAARGAHDALALDPGGASTLYVKAQGGVVSSPSDGVERPVANHLGILFGPLPPGTLVGFVKVKDVFNGAPIPGAVVTLDDGQTDTVGANGLYTFTDLSPRYTCATADAPGYHPATACKVVVSGTMVYNSIALFPDSDFIDAGPDGPPDASLPGTPDAAPQADGGDPGGGDGGPGGDGGDDGGGDGGTCGCRAPGHAGGHAGRAGHAGIGACVLGLFAAMLLTIRGGRKTPK